MSKSMLIIDTPTCCGWCPCCKHGVHGCYCNINGRMVDPEDKPEWCEMKSVQYSEDNINKKENDISYCNEIKKWIHILCESREIDIDENEFAVEVKPKCTYHRTGNILIQNMWEFTFEIKLSEKEKKFEFYLLSSADPKYVAKYALIGYVKRKEEYNNKIVEPNNKEPKSLFKKIFG